MRQLAMTPWYLGTCFESTSCSNESSSNATPRHRLPHCTHTIIRKMLSVQWHLHPQPGVIVAQGLWSSTARDEPFLNSDGYRGCCCDVIMRANDPGKQQRSRDATPIKCFEPVANSLFDARTALSRLLSIGQNGASLRALRSDVLRRCPGDILRLGVSYRLRRCFR